MRMTRIAAAVLIAAIGLDRAPLGVLGADDQTPQPDRASVFDLPLRQAGYVRLRNELRTLFEQKKYAEAEGVCRQMVALADTDPTAWYNLACALAMQQKTDAALESLERAVKLGFRDQALLKTDSDLRDLRGSERFAKIVERAGAPPPDDPPEAARAKLTPNAPKDGVVLVDDENTVWDSRLQLFRSFFRFEDPPPREAEVVRGLKPAGELLTEWWREGTAAGNYGDVYDNHDSDHSNMNYRAFPQLARIEFSEEAKKRRFHHGLQNRFLYNAVTIGNSSTAITGGPIWRSQPRLALTNAQATLSLVAQYSTNHVYVYPEHRDHDPGHNGGRGATKDGPAKEGPADDRAKGYGDVYSANTPYLVISQGSSGSDRTFLTALAATLAAFRPETKAALREQGLIAPTLQMILRRAYRPVATDADYLSGKAHPTVFEGDQLDIERMVRMAHEITADALPPVARLRVLEEDKPVLGRDYFHPQPIGEHLFDTPAAIARVGRSVRNRRRLVVSAEPSADPNARPLSYHWVVLRGDPERIRIKPLDEQGKVAEIQVDYHPRRPTSAESPIESNRVDIGLFVHNGRWYSAPAFICYYFPDNELRTYDEQGRIQVVDYANESIRANYVDPLIVARKDWRDEYTYDAQGQLTGWTRIRGNQRQRFTADGLLVTGLDDENRPTNGRSVRYTLERDRRRGPSIRWEPVGEERDLP